MDAPASSPPILFNSELARRIALRLQDFFFKNIYQLRALMLLKTSLILNRTTTGNKVEVTYRLNLYLFTAFDFSIHIAALLSWSFTTRELYVRPEVHNSSTTGVSTTHHHTRDTDSPE